VLIVAHSTLIRLTLCLALGIDLAAYRSAMPRLDRATLTEIRVDAEGHIGLVRYNAPIVWLARQPIRDRPLAAVTSLLRHQRCADRRPLSVD